MKVTLPAITRIFSFLVLLFFIQSEAYAASKLSEPMTTTNIFDVVKQNTNWKTAFATGQQAQVVFMNVSPSTNPKNEIGMEVHPFDQIIFIVSGNATVVLNGKSSQAENGSMIFIPKGTKHNVINLNKDQPLQLLSVYSQTDIPAGSTLKVKSSTD